MANIMDWIPKLSFKKVWKRDKFLLYDLSEDTDKCDKIMLADWGTKEATRSEVGQVPEPTKVP